MTACVEHFDIYEAVFGMLTRLLHDGDAANTVAFVIGCLHECVRSEFGSSKYDVGAHFFLFILSGLNTLTYLLPA